MAHKYLQVGSFVQLWFAAQRQTTKIDSVAIDRVKLMHAPRVRYKLYIRKVFFAFFPWLVILTGAR